MISFKARSIERKTNTKLNQDKGERRAYAEMDKLVIWAIYC